MPVKEKTQPAMVWRRSRPTRRKELRNVRRLSRWAARSCPALTPWKKVRPRGWACPWSRRRSDYQKTFAQRGLLHYFLGIRNPTILDTHPSRGASWESFVVEHIISGFQLLVPGCQAFYWRTSTGVEVDLLIDRGDRVLPLEIKLYSAPKQTDVRGLMTCMADLGLRKGYVVYPGKDAYSLGSGITVLPAESLLGHPQDLKVL